MKNRYNPGFLGRLVTLVYVCVCVCVCCNCESILLNFVGYNSIQTCITHKYCKLLTEAHIIIIVDNIYLKPDRVFFFLHCQNDSH